jgi:hypothetical protein
VDGEETDPETCKAQGITLAGGGDKTVRETCRVRGIISERDGRERVLETCKAPGITLAGDGDRTALEICKEREIISVKDGEGNNRVKIFAGIQELMIRDIDGETFRTLSRRTCPPRPQGSEFFIEKERFGVFHERGRDLSIRKCGAGSFWTSCNI